MTRVIDDGRAQATASQDAWGTCRSAARGLGVAELRDRGAGRAARQI